MRSYIIAALSILGVVGIVIGIVKGVPYWKSRQALEPFTPFSLDDGNATYYIERDDQGKTYLVYTEYAPGSSSGVNTVVRVRTATAEQLSYGLAEEEALKDIVAQEGSRSRHVRVTGDFYCYKGGSQKVNTYTNVCKKTQEPTLVIETIEFAQ